MQPTYGAAGNATTKDVYLECRVYHITRRSICHCTARSVEIGRREQKRHDVLDRQRGCLMQIIICGERIRDIMGLLVMAKSKSAPNGPSPINEPPPPIDDPPKPPQPDEPPKPPPVNDPPLEEKPPQCERRQAMLRSR
jgi:hypothetical protein